MLLPSPSKFTRCRVCGYDYAPDFFPWGETGNSPTFEICQGCGVEFGYSDTNLEGIIAYRQHYLEGLSLQRQSKVEADIANLPAQFKL